MSDTEPVDPVGIPVFTGDLALLDTKVTTLSGHGAAIATAAGDVHSSFGGLSAFYKAPEAEQLFATTRPVAETGLSLSSDLCVIAGALSTYSDDAFPLVEKLRELKRDAVAFRVKAEGDDKWREDGDLVEENNRRRGEIAEVWTAFQEVERTCHAKIVALVGGKALKIDDGSGKKGTYGYDAEALKQAKSLPWGEAVEESTPWWQVWEHAYDFGKGFLVDGVWGTLKGLGTLVGFEGGDAAQEAWTGLAKLATGLSPAVMLVLHALPGDHSAWIRDSQTAVKETGKALIAWDQWGSNPSRAAGAVTFNVLTTVFTGGSGGAAAGAGKAGLAAKALSLTSKTARAVDPMTYVFKGAGVGLRRIGDVMAGLKGLGHVEFPPLPDHVITLPEGTLGLPDGTLHLPEGAAVPEGATTLPNGTVKLPDGAVALPEGTVRSPFDEGAPYLDRHGNLYNEDGTLAQHTDQAHQQPRAQAPDPLREPALTGAGAHTGDDATRLGNDLGDLGRPRAEAPGGGAGNHLPDSNPHHAPGGGTGDNTPHNHLDNSGHSDVPSRDHGSDNPAVPHQGEHGEGMGTAAHASQAPEGSSGVSDHTAGSASSPEEALSPTTHVGESGAVPPPGHGQKLMEQIDANGPRVTKTGGVITHIDGRPVADYLDELAQQRGAAYRDARDSGAFPRKQTGACVGSVMDVRTGTIIEGINGKREVVIKKGDLHPTLKDRLDKIGDPPPHEDDPLGHAEVKAANELLWMRTRQGLPDGAAALAEMRAAVDFPYLKDVSTGLPGRRAPFCANCNHMLEGLPSRHGRFTGFPPSDENWIS
ncbi:YwqJ-related putative deaminase [Streptomyces sp. NBC_01363]|uniref:YwqJ-related putative deaminase n=1 Tax=Streptomyces sp. NBC_01363 TaxID=2903840 RepID=UPI002251699B|nr:YwqJ-related putative deaminase [Streptomyces sp. NBC_01363]MCX4730598.1 YwqJ-related putative deaminase [Streptomyces sp. NBC_01363]